MAKTPPPKSDTPLQTLLAKLDRVTKTASGWLAKCPAHIDDSPSLSVSEGQGGRILVRCHAGCTTEQIVTSVGLAVRDLFPQRDSPAPAGTRFGEVAAVYDYHDENGTVISRVLRDVNKNFKQQRYDGVKQEFVDGVKGVKRVLYRLPEVLSAIQMSHPVYLVEGEKDADNLSRLGLVATTMPGGVGMGWKEEYTDQLDGADVVFILPDNDVPGNKHARAVRKSLRKRVGKVRIVRIPGLPESGDVSDFIGAGGTKAQLDDLVTAPEKLEGWIDAINLLNKPLPDVDWLVDGLLSRPSIAVLSGDYATFKSWLGLDLSISIATGGKWIGKFGTPKDRVMYVTADEDEAEVRRKLLFLTNGNPLDPQGKKDLADNLLFWIGDLDFSSDESFEQLSEDVATFQPALIVIDHLRICVAGEENSSEFGRDVKRRSKSLLEWGPSCVLWYHHWNKPNKEKGDDPRKRIRGSGSIGGVADHSLAVAVNDSEVITFMIDKQKKGRKMSPFTILPRFVDLEGMAAFEYAGDGEDPTASFGATKTVLDLVRSEYRKWTKPELVSALTGKLDERTIRRALQVLEGPRARAIEVWPSVGRRPMVVQAKETKDWTPPSEDLFSGKEATRTTRTQPGKGTRIPSGDVD